MAKQEQPREDLVRDATAYDKRAEFSVEATTVFFGVRPDGGVSFYVNEDPVFHFNSNGELRRAFVDGDIYKAQAGRIIRLKRDRSQEKPILKSQPLTPEEQKAMLQATYDGLQRLNFAAAKNALTLSRVEPTDFNASNALQKYIAHLPNPIVVAQAANAK